MTSVFSEYVKSKYKRWVRTLGAATVITMGGALSATAQSTTIPQAISTTPGGSASTTVTGLSPTANGDATVTLNIYGDIGGALGFNETLEIRFDGVVVASFTDVAQCSAFSRTITVPQATLAPLVSDGQIVVSYQASPTVGNFCAGINGVPGSVSFQVDGSINYPGNTVSGGAPVSSSNDTVTRFLQTRARALVQNQPDVVRFVDGRSGGHFNADVSQGAGMFDIQSGSIGPFWVSAQGSWSDDTIGNQDYFLASVGGHFVLGQNAVVGAMLQYDLADRSEAGVADVKGTGWLVGPYFATQLGNNPLYLDGRLLYGRTDNEVTPSGGTKSEFEGERWLASLGLEGKMEYGRFTLFPGVDVNHVRDSQDAYLDSTSTLISAQTIELTDVAIALDFETPILGDNPNMMLTGGVSGIWSDTDGTGLAATTARFDDGWRGRVDLGYRYDNGKGFKSDANIFVDGLGEDKRESYGLSVLLSFDF